VLALILTIYIMLSCLLCHCQTVAIGCCNVIDELYQIVWKTVQHDVDEADLFLGTVIVIGGFHLVKSCSVFVQ